MITPERITELRKLAEAATAECCACGSRVIHHVADEGTQSYQKIDAGMTELLDEVERLRDALQLYAEPAFWDFGNAKPEGGFLARAALGQGKAGES